MRTRIIAAILAVLFLFSGLASALGEEEHYRQVQVSVNLETAGAGDEIRWIIMPENFQKGDVIEYSICVDLYNEWIMDLYPYTYKSETLRVKDVAKPLRISFPAYFTGKTYLHLRWLDLNAGGFIEQDCGYVQVDGYEQIHAEIAQDKTEVLPGEPVTWTITPLGGTPEYDILLRIDAEQPSGFAGILPYEETTAHSAGETVQISEELFFNTSTYYDESNAGTSTFYDARVIITDGGGYQEQVGGLFQVKLVGGVPVAVAEIRPNVYCWDGGTATWRVTIRGGFPPYHDVTLQILQNGRADLNYGKILQEIKIDEAAEGQELRFNYTVDESVFCYGQLKPDYETEALSYSGTMTDSKGYQWQFYATSDLTWLKRGGIELPSSLTKIEAETFSSLGDYLVIFVPDSVQAIDDSAFGEYNWRSLFICSKDSAAWKWFKDKGFAVREDNWY